jgi:hypothetical protein
MGDQSKSTLPSEFELKLYRRIRNDLFVKTLFDLTFTALFKVIVVFAGLFTGFLARHNRHEKEVHHE